VAGVWLTWIRIRKTLDSLMSEVCLLYLQEDPSLPNSVGCTLRDNKENVPAIFAKVHEAVSGAPP
jgi:hypothetical protein